MTQRVLNVGGGNKGIALPENFNGWEHVLLDIDQSLDPDVCADARELEGHEPKQYEAVYCSHNLEHYHRHEVPTVLRGFRHVLKRGGFCYIRVPNLQQVLQEGGELTDVVYQSPSGPITVLDIIYGHAGMIAASGNSFYAHKTGFSDALLYAALLDAGFGNVEVHVMEPIHELVGIGYRLT